MWFVCGLGNPGKKYENTRHNIGFYIIDEIIKKYNFKLQKKDLSKELYKGSIENYKCMVCKPLNFMNLSGQVISEIVSFYKIPKSKILIIHDDLDLQLGKVKIKTGGGNAGHNGLLSIDNAIGKNYKRLRIGIGHPGLKELVSSYVLKKFNKKEKSVLNNLIDFFTENFQLIFDKESLLLTKFAEKLKKN